MPNSKRSDLSVLARLVERPYSHAMAIYLMVTGLNSWLFFGGVAGPFPVLLVAIFGVAGAPLVIAGLQWRGSTVTALNLERTGQIFTAGAWVTYFYILMVLGSSPFGFLAPALFFVATGLRVFGLSKRLRTVRKAIKDSVSDTQ